jgi:hypothetical protein
MGTTMSEKNNALDLLCNVPKTDLDSHIQIIEMDKTTGA